MTQVALLKWTYTQWREETTRINALIKGKLAEIGESNLRVRWSWNDSFTRRMGDAKHDTNRQGGVMRFSKPLWVSASEAERTETVLHELAHVIIGCQHGVLTKWTARGPRRDAHGPKFTSMLIKLGGTGARTHNVNRDHVKRKQARFGGPCPGCGAEITFSKSVRTKWLRGHQTRRHGCGQRLDSTWAATQRRA